MHCNHSVNSPFPSHTPNVLPQIYICQDVMRCVVHVSVTIVVSAAPLAVCGDGSGDGLLKVIVVLKFAAVVVVLVVQQW